MALSAINGVPGACITVAPCQSVHEYVIHILTMAEKGGLSSNRLTNHSARKRMIQKLNDSDIPPSHIKQLSGHRNVQSINNYSHISQQQQKTCQEYRVRPRLNVLQNFIEHSLATEGEAETLTCSFQSSSIPSMHGASLFSGAVFHGGRFKIPINTVNHSPNANSVK